MSLLFDNTNDSASATGTPPVTAIPLTIALWHKATGLGAADMLIQLGTGGGSNLNSVGIQKTTGNAAQSRTYDGTINNNLATTATFADTNWHHYAATWQSATERYVYLDGSTGSSGSASESSRAPAAAFTDYKVGEMFDGTLDTGGNIGYIAVWDIKLTSGQIDSLAAGAHPKTIELANLKWYVEATNSGAPFVDEMAGFNLSASGNTVYDAAEPTVDPFLFKYLKLLAHASAASATSVEGVVLNSTRDTVIGEFSGKSFEATLESGKAVLKVLASDITPDGSTMTTSTTPLAIAYNATKTTPLVSCTVIEE